jgi:hypothetical protein
LARNADINMKNRKRDERFRKAMIAAGHAPQAPVTAPIDGVLRTIHAEPTRFGDSSLVG